MRMLFLGIRRWGFLCLAGVLLVLAILALRSDRRPHPATLSPNASPRNGHHAPAPSSSSRPAPIISTRATVQKRPLAVSFTRGKCEWTGDDGRDTNIIRHLAHNELEYARMLDENSRIFRRQLVYRKETAAMLLERAKLTGESIRQLTLPALDGREVQFEITRADVRPSGLEGTFTGRVAGAPDSLVTFAFKVNREAFTILSPSEGLYVQADPREPGEVILKQINPATYAAGMCGNL